MGSARLTDTASNVGGLRVMLAVRRLSKVVGDHGEGSSIGAREIDEMEADSQRLPADVADPLAAHDQIVSSCRVRGNGAEQAVHGVNGDPCADTVLLPLVTLEGHAIGRVIHTRGLNTFLQLIFLAVIVIAAHVLGYGTGVGHALDRCSREVRTIVVVTATVALVWRTPLTARDGTCRTGGIHHLPVPAADHVRGQVLLRSMSRPIRPVDHTAFSNAQREQMLMTHPRVRCHGLSGEGSLLTTLTIRPPEPWHRRRREGDRFKVAGELRARG